MPASELLVIVQSRDYNRPLDVNEVGEFITVVDDVQANKGVLVAQNGFSQAAMNLAKTAGIDLLTLVDAENKLWSEYFPNRGRQLVRFSVLIKYSSLNATVAIPHQPLQSGFQVDGNLWMIPLYENGRFIGRMFDVVGTLWGKGSIVDEEGVSDYLLQSEKPVVLSGDPSQSELTNFLIKGRVSHAHYVCKMPVNQLQGFYNNIEHSVTTKTLGLGPAKFHDLMREGRAVPREEADSLSPPTMGFDIADAWDVNETFQMPSVTIRRIATANTTG